MTLVDTSVWIAVFRKKEPLELEHVVPLDEVVTCLPVVQEVLQGFRDEAAFRLARESMMALPRVESPMGPDVFHEAASLYRTARRAGWTVRSSVDCLIAACALRNDLEVLHVDRDYDALAKVSQLRERRAG
ncbi:MAG: type II toxin-antitoxin system VapC family toxin [Myxococcota bacterium]